ncbi:hypothetical protein H9L39_08176 [Fusarium oxysporum f. sp. albedinis]|nr:hypothetical protein H9L39_08176 [Fusarium oxysporum f. sp. albedinis]
MSGAEAALLGVGILCNAMQILTFAKDSIHVYRNIRDGRAPDPELDSYLRNAKASFDEMNQTAAQMRPLSQAQQQIVDFTKLHVDGASKSGLRGKITASKKSVVALWRGKELQDAEKNLQRHEQLLHSLLLDRVCTQSQAAEISSLQSFGHLQGALQSIISQLVGGSTKVSDLFTDFSSNVTDRLAEEHVATRTVIEEHVNLAENTIHRSIAESVDKLRQELLEREQDKVFQKQYERLLSSLWFSEMNSRKNKISNNYPGTFGWVFELHRSLRTDHDSSPGFDQSSIDSQVPENTHVNDMTICRCFNSAESTEKPCFDCFPCWLESDSNLFWISGKPASGKSSLTKFLAFNNSTVNHLNSWHSNVQILTHFFWKPGQLLQQNVEGMVLSLLYQALDDKPGLCRRLCQAQPPVRHKRSHSDWSLDELIEALVWTLEASPEAFCIFLDGLDEAKELEHLPWPDWTDSQVIHRLLKLKDVKAEGVFLWVALVVDRLNRAIRQGYTSSDMLQERLRQTPSDLTTLYTGMWGRIGDDARLRSIRVTASLYFNLVIAAREVEEDLFTGGLPYDPAGGGMSSLLVMATAAQDKSMEAILSTGRVITVGELLVRCSQVENELRFACRGLLEVTKPPHMPKFICTGDNRLLEYNLQKVDFIHRSAFDFLVDTELGHECLHVCGSSKSEQASRLFAAHLIRARFIYLKQHHRNRPMDIRQLLSYRNIVYDAYLHMAISIPCDIRLFGDSSVQDGLLDVRKAWQSSGLFSGHTYWTPPAYSPSSSNYLEVELIEATILVVIIRGYSRYWTVGGTNLLEKYPASIFLDAVPAMLRACSVFHARQKSLDLPSDLLKYILRRLQCIATEEAQHQGAVKRSIRALHSWSPIAVKDRDFVTELSNTVGSEDLQHVLLLQLHANIEVMERFESFQSPERSADYTHYALVAVNLATAYRLLDEVILEYLLGTLRLRSPHNVNFRFDVSLVADMYQPSSNTYMFRVNCYKPSRRFHDQIKHFLQAALSRDRMLDRGKTWPEMMKCSDTELSPIDASNADNYVTHTLKEWGGSFLLPVISLRNHQMSYN